MKSENTKIIAVFVIPVAVILLLSVIVPGAVTAEEIEDEEENDTKDYIVREPIRIDGNDDFAAQAADEGWPGDGSEGNPYVIEGYEIDGTGYGYGIYVGNTTVHFVVRSCYVHNASGVEMDYDKGVPIEKAVYNSGIILFNVQNGILESNALINNVRAGIYLSGSINIKIVYNNLPKNNGVIRLSGSDYNVISNNNVSGIGLSSSSDNLISYNDVSREEFFLGSGIYLGHSNDNFINNNTISNYERGIFLDTSFDNEIEDNTFSNVETEIEFIEMVENGNETNDDKIPAPGFVFFVIVVLAVITVIWIKKDKIGELKK